MATTTILRSNNGKCPLWGVDVSVCGWYREAPSGAWKFLRAECPIIQNSRLPRHEQQQVYELMSCDNYGSRPLYKEFQPVITKDI